MEWGEGREERGEVYLAPLSRCSSSSGSGGGRYGGSRSFFGTIVVVQQRCWLIKFYLQINKQIIQKNSEGRKRELEKENENEKNITINVGEVCDRKG